MKATLEFILPEDQLEFKHATKAVDYYLTLHDIDHKIRSFLKYNDDKTLDTAITLFESIRSDISDTTFNSE